MSHELYACRGARSEIGRDYHARDSAGTQLMRSVTWTKTYDYVDADLLKLNKRFLIH